MRWPALADLALIGDRRSCAAIGKDAAVYWHAPHRFDRPSIFNALLDPAKGAWRIVLPHSSFARRRYVADSAVLETTLAAAAGELTITDWMTLGEAPPGLFCRRLSPAPGDVTISFDAWHDDGRRRALPAIVDDAAVFEDGLHLFASHPLKRDKDGVSCVLPRGEAGWSVLASGPRRRPREEELDHWKAHTIERWRTLAETTRYDGPYREQALASLRQLRLLVYEPTGAIAAAATTGLPEVIHGRRNYDYRYCWLRDSSLMILALLRTVPGSTEGEAFLRFIASSRARRSREPLDAVITIEGRPVAAESNPPLVGYRKSGPVRIGNRAGRQLQLGALGDLLLAASLLYRKHGRCPHWPAIEAVGDFVSARWRQPDSGIWESPVTRQYTASKVFAACGLEAIAPFADRARAERYRQSAQAIRGYVMRHCLTREGAFAAFEGSQGVDVSAALFPVWAFCAPDAPEMDATLRVLERDYASGGLFRREDETPQSRLEGAFLPGSFWVAQYWASRGDAQRARRYVEAGLAHANDLGVMAEEVDWRSGAVLGNLPLGMAHASFLSALSELAMLMQQAGRSGVETARRSSSSGMTADAFRR